MFRLAELFVEIGARTGGLTSALSGVHNRLLGVGTLGQGLSGIIHSTTLGLMGMAGTAGALGVVAAGLGKAAMSAGHLREAISKAEQAFGSSTDRIVAMADRMAASVGAVRTEVLDAAASFGLMLQGAGIGREASAQMSEALSRVAIDAASYFDVSLSEALMRLQSGLSGEMEAVRRWGVNLSETNVANKARAMGLGGNGRDLDQSTKTLVRFKIMMDSLNVVVGDAERSQGRLVGQWKLLQGNLDTLITQVGNQVTPMFTALTAAANSLLGGFNKLNASYEQSGSPATAANRFGLWVRSLFTGEEMPGPQKQVDAEAARQKAIDEARAKAQQDFLADQQAAAEAQAKQAQAHEPKGWMGGIDEWAKHLQEGAWGKDKDKLQKDQLAMQQQARDLLQKILAKMGQPVPVVT